MACRSSVGRWRRDRDREKERKKKFKRNVQGGRRRERKEGGRGEDCFFGSFDTVKILIIILSQK